MTKKKMIMMIILKADTYIIMDNLEDGNSGGNNDDDDDNAEKHRGWLRYPWNHPRWFWWGFFSREIPVQRNNPSEMEVGGIEFDWYLSAILICINSINSIIDSIMYRTPLCC